MSLSNILERFRNPAPAVATVAAITNESAIRMAIAPNWKRSLGLVDDKLAELQTRRAKLQSDRREVIVKATLEDDPVAKRTLDGIERALAALDVDTARVGDARAVAADKLAEEQEAEARKQYAQDVARWERDAEALAALGERGDAKAREAAEVFKELAERSEALARSAPVELRGLPSERPLGFGRVSVAARHALAIHGLEWAWMTPFRWPAPPSISETVASGVTWARGEIERANRRKNVA